MKTFVSMIALCFGSLAAVALPAQPTQPEHPGSAAAPYQVQHEVYIDQGRQVDVYMPVGLKAPVIVFGHGQAISVTGYELTFQHLAEKGIAVIHPTYDDGFFDQDWRRMAGDFNAITARALDKFAANLDRDRLVFSGHSKGAYVALTAAGLFQNSGLRIGSVVLFAPAGYDGDAIKSTDPSVPVTLVWTDKDSIIKRDLIQKIYDLLPSQHKQFIEVQSYPELRADHFFLLNKKYIFGGQNGVTPYHYYTSWKWLVGAAQDVGPGNKSSVMNPYLYGAEALTSGVDGLHHKVTKNW